MENKYYVPVCLYFNVSITFNKFQCFFIYIPICFYFNSGLGRIRGMTALFTFQYVSILIQSSCPKDYSYHIYIPICFYFNSFEHYYTRCESKFTFQYVSILIHHPNSRFFSTLFPHFLLTSQSLQIFYYISFINSTKEKQNHLFFTLVEFCRCTGIFTLSEVDSLKIVVME